MLHYTGMKTSEEALERLCDPEAKVSAHYLIEESGRTHALVPEERRAWHAGISEWGGDSDVNAMSIGIELANPGHEWGYRGFPDDQIDALIRLMGGIMERHAIPAGRVVGHSDIAPDRKEDPGEKFPWNQLAAEKLAAGPWSGETPLTIPSEEGATELLKRIGYGVDRFGVDPCVVAFQRRFCPGVMGEGLGKSTRSAIAEACAKVSGLCG